MYAYSHLAKDPIATLLNIDVSHIPVNDVVISHTKNEKWIDWKSYLVLNPDLEQHGIASCIDVMNHYYRHGFLEKRSYFITSDRDTTEINERERENINSVYLFPGDKPSILLTFHGIYTRLHGTGLYVERFCERFKDQYNIICLYPWINDLVRIEINNYIVHVKSLDNNYDEILKILNSLNINCIYNSHLIYFNFTNVLKLLKELNSPIVTILHDYLYIATDQPNPEIVFQEKEITKKVFGISKFLVCPSKSIYDNYKHYYQSENYLIIPHEEFSYSDTNIELGNYVLVTGTMGISHKGYDHLKNVAKICPGVAFKVLGSNAETKGNITSLGTFYANDLTKLIKTHNPKLLWIPALYLESYCYTLSYYLQSGYPILMPDIPIFKERCEDYKQAYFYPVNTSYQEIADIIKELLAKSITVSNQAIMISNCNSKYVELTHSIINNI